MRKMHTFTVRKVCSSNGMGVEWKQAPRRFGLDLNRNFPSHWEPFSMFGMDGGMFSLSEPESRALIDAFTQRPFIAAALTNHTYTGAILTQPSRENSRLEQKMIFYFLSGSPRRSSPIQIIEYSASFLTLHMTRKSQLLGYGQTP